MRTLDLTKKIPWRWRHLKCLCWERFLDKDKNRLEGYSFLCAKCHKPFIVDPVICEECGKEFLWAAIPDTHRDKVNHYIPTVCYHCLGVRTFQHLQEPRTPPKIEDLTMPTFTLEPL